jgi:hypothetical protein
VHIVQALADAVEHAGLLSFFPLTEQTHGFGDRLVGGGEPAALDLGPDKLLEVFGQLGVRKQNSPVFFSLPREVVFANHEGAGGLAEP